MFSFRNRIPKIADNIPNSNLMEFRLRTSNFKNYSLEDLVKMHAHSREILSCLRTDDPAWERFFLDTRSIQDTATFKYVFEHGENGSEYAMLIDERYWSEDLVEILNVYNLGWSYMSTHANRFGEPAGDVRVIHLRKPLTDVQNNEAYGLMKALEKDPVPRLVYSKLTGF